MAKLTADEFQEKHARRLKASITDITAGVNRVTTSPMAQAASKQDKMRTNLNAALDSGKWAAGLKRVSLEDWKTKTITKGTGRIAAGIDGAADKVKAFASELLPFQDNLIKKVKAMPDTTLEDSIQRMNTFVRGMSTFKRTS
jgi:ElaB/YqjD/DUF883 family membrane-anchored ribosome-binding protein